MASSSKSKRIYDVFLSFRGTDLRNNFLGHLYRGLDQNGIYTFVDNEKLRKGDQISLALMKAIEQSCIAIIIFSEEYASSRWCLEEMVKIMECKEQKDLIVLPVFYKVDPSQVRGGRESYRRALAMHESNFGKDSEKVKRWKKALFDAGSLSGWHLNDGDESELIQRIVKEVSTHLKRTPLYVAKHPIGIESQVGELKAILNLESDDDVVMVGLWGQGGIGKTTLAKALYNSIFRQFEGSCFLADVRQSSKGCKGLLTLQKTLLNEILSSQQQLKVYNVDGGINLIQHRLHHKKVLLILDDVDDLRQLNALAGEVNWFGDGSRIIVTTRDKQLLTCHKIDQNHMYEVRLLFDNEAYKLLRNHASPRHQKLEIRTDLVMSVLKHAKGLPLALEVLGSFLCGRNEHEWESTLNKLSKIPNKEINDVLKISYDGLEANEKEIFLHIACFFKGRKSEDVKKVLNSCDLEATIGFKILMERSLIKAEYGVLQMHDLIQFMGMDIVNQECRDDPGRRSRLWLYDDVLDVLSHDMGDCAIKAIVLEPPEPKEICTGLDAFAKMRKLRLLIMHNVHDSFQGPICLPNELRWFEWPGCASRIPEFSTGPKKLVGLDMSKGNVTGVVKQFKDFQHLKYINFSYCKSLICMPDLSSSPYLEELNLENCKNLVEVHESIGYQDKLQLLNLWKCSQLSIFPNVLRLKNLRDLNLGKCKKFKRFPEIPHKLEGLKDLCLTETAITELPESIKNIVSLEGMDLRKCKNLLSFPPSICTKLIGFPKNEGAADPCMKTGLANQLSMLNVQSCKSVHSALIKADNATLGQGFQNLKYINFSNCEWLLRMPNLSCTPNLKELVLKNCKSLVEAHESLACHDKLEVLNLRECSQLRIFSNVLKSKNLRTLDLKNCTKFERFLDIPQKLQALTELYLEGTAITEIPVSIENLVSLATMFLDNCKNLVHLPSSIYKLQNLIKLRAKCCTSLIGFPKYEDSTNPCMKIGLSKLDQLDLHGCNLSEVEFLENLSCFPNIYHLDLSGNNITSLPTSINKRNTLSSLNVRNCHQLQEIPELPPFLNFLLADNCESLQNHGELTSFPQQSMRYVILPGGEMPEWVLPVEERSTSFRVYEYLYDNFLKVAVCVVLGNDEEVWEDSLHFVTHVNGKMVEKNTCRLSRLDLGHTLLHYLSPYELWKGVDFGQIDGSYLQFSLTVLGNSIKKWGFQIICKRLNDDLKVMLRDNRLFDLALLYETDWDSSDDKYDATIMSSDSDSSSEDSSSEVYLPGDLKDRERSNEEHIQIGSKRNHEFILPQAKRIKIMLTSNSTDGDESGSVGSQLLELE